jgi:hypothetical protein
MREERRIEMDNKSSLRQRCQWVLVGVLGILLLFGGVDCDGTTDQVRRSATRVWGGQPAGNPPELLDNNWHALNTGDAVKADDTGEAELTLVDCKGSIWVFKNTSMGACECTKQVVISGILCLCWGDAGFDMDCAGRLTVGTGSCIINAASTAFTVSYLPESDMLTLVTVLAGRVEVTPVLDIDSGELAEEAISVKGGQFVFTQPGPEPEPIAGLPARTALSIEQLPDLVEELDIQPRFDDITTWGLERKILPPVWPFMPNVGLWDRGSPLEQAGVEETLLSAIDFEEVLPRSLPGTEQIAFTVTPLSQDTVDAYSLPYDPEKAKQQLAEGAYPDGFAVQVAYPEGDRLLAEMAESIARQLANVGLDAKAVAVPADKMGDYLRTAPKDTVTFWLSRM